MEDPGIYLLLMETISRISTFCLIVWTLEAAVKCWKLQVNLATVVLNEYIVILFRLD